MDTCKCDLCGKPVKRGYVWDGIHVFCTKKCVAKALDGDLGCVNILLDDGERLVYYDDISEFLEQKEEG